MSRSSRRILLTLLISVGLSFGGGVSLSKWMWGYWFSPPSAAPELVRLDRLDFFVELEPQGAAPELRWRATAVSPDELAKGAANHARSAEYNFWTRLHAAVREWNATAAPSGSPDAGLLREIEAYVNRSQLLVPGGPDYRTALEVHGYAAGGPAAPQGVLVLLALAGWEVSNDHRPVYDFAFLCRSAGGDCRAIREERYFEDVAGIEGVRWQALSALTAVLLLVVGFAIAPILGIALLLRRLLAARGAT